MPWRRKWQPSPEFLPGKSHGQRNLVGYHPWGRRNQTRLSVHTCTPDSQARACHPGCTQPSRDRTAERPRAQCWLRPLSCLYLNHSLRALLIQMMPGPPNLPTPQVSASASWGLGCPAMARKEGLRPHLSRADWPSGISLRSKQWGSVGCGQGSGRAPAATENN